MFEQTVDVVTRAGAMETFLVRPGGSARVPAVFMLMDAPGIREELREMARRLAGAGYCVLLPNLYYRAGRDSTFGPDVLARDSPEYTRMRAIRTRMTIPPVMEDVADMLAFIEGLDNVAARRVGVHGYCMSGPYALAAAAHFPERVAAAASFYGTWLVSDAQASPHLTFAQSRGELHIGCAEHDDLAPPDMVDELRRHFDTSGANGRLEMYEGVHHGFAFPERWCYDAVAAERHWARLFELYRRNLTGAIA